MQLQLVFASAVLALAASTHQVAAYSKYMKLIPNGAAVPDAPAVGHPDAEGAEGVNDFGKAFKAAGNAWTKALCMADTDGDGFTNGQELGDPCCTWTPTAPGTLISTGISHPSDKTKTPSNAALIAGCSTTGAATTTAPAAGAKNATTTAPAATTAKAKETVSDVLAPVSATKSPSASKSMDIDDFASSSTGSSTAKVTKAPNKSASSNSSANTTSAATALPKGASSSIAAAVALVCVSALAAAF